MQIEQHRASTIPRQAVPLAHAVSASNTFVHRSTAGRILCVHSDREEPAIQRARDRGRQLLPVTRSSARMHIRPRWGMW